MVAFSLSIRKLRLVDDKQDGATNTYYSDGRLEMEITYQNGEPVR